MNYLYAYMEEVQDQLDEIKTTEQQASKFNEKGEQHPFKLSRRQVVGLGAAAAVTAVLGGELGHEESLAKRGYFETNLARWYPIYERHDEHGERFVPDNIPPKLDALSVELKVNPITQQGQNEQVEKISYLKIDPLRLILTKVKGKDTFPPSEYLLIPIETLKYLQDIGIPVAFGDITYTQDQSQWSLESALKVRALIGAIFMEFGLLLTNEDVLRKAKINRRGFSQLVGASLATVGTAAFLPVVSKTPVHSNMMNAIQTDSPQQRIWARLNTIVNYLVPEQLNDLFRELIQANKLMALAKKINQDKPGEKAKIGYNWHLGHRGIEDWLRLGEDVTRACILAFPDSVLEQVVKANGDDERVLYAMRLIKVPQSLKILQIDEKNVAYNLDEKEKVKDIIVEDHELADSLKER
jgi:hypothetical protein